MSVPVAPLLSEQDLAQFAAQGWVRVPQAFPRAAALAIQEQIWAHVRTARGIERDDRSTWPRGAYAGGLGDNTAPEFNEGIAAPRLCAAIDQLLGAGTWQVPPGWGGFLITFPSGSEATWDVTAREWHWDDVLPNHFDHPLRALFVFTLFSEVRPRGGGTLLVSGSHRLIERFYRGLSPAERQEKQKSLKPRFVRSHGWFRELCGDRPAEKERVTRFMEREQEVDGVPVRVVEVTGEPGDAFLCHACIWHAASPNHAEVPRFMRIKGLRQSRTAAP